MKYMKYFISMLLGIGVFFTWYYLYHLNRLDLFYLAIVSNPIDSLWLVIASVIFFLLICLILFMPSIIYFSFIQINTSMVKKGYLKKIYNYFFWLGFSTLLFLSIYLFHPYQIFIWVAYAFMPIVVAIILYLKLKIKKDRFKNFVIFCFLMVSINLTFLFPFFIYISDAARSNEEVDSCNMLFFLGIMLFLLFVSLVPVMVFESNNPENPENSENLALRIIKWKKGVISLFLVLFFGMMIVLLLGKGRQINFKALTALGMVQADVRQYKINRENYLPTMFDQTIWGEGFKVDEKYIYVNAIRLFRLNGTNLICPPLIEKYLDEVKGTDNGILGGMHNSPNQIRQYTHLCLVINDSEIALWPYPRDIKMSHTINSQ